MRPVAITSTPFSGTMPRRADGGFPDDAGELGALVLQREIDVAGGVALQFGDLAAHADAAELALQRALHRAGDFRDGVFGDVGGERSSEVVHAGRVDGCDGAGECQASPATLGVPLYCDAICGMAATAHQAVAVGEWDFSNEEDVPGFEREY